MLLRLITLPGRFARAMPCTASACLCGWSLSLGALPLPLFDGITWTHAAGLMAGAGLVAPALGFVCDSIRHLILDIAQARAERRGDTDRAAALEKAFLGL